MSRRAAGPAAPSAVGGAGAVLPVTFREDCPLEAGTDEAGRGCLAGPVVAAAVILPPGFRLPGLTDSKALTDACRRRLRDAILPAATAWAVAQATVQEIDTLNILHASLLAMRRALEGLEPAPAAVAVDGNRWDPWPGRPAVSVATVVGGDGRLANIAAASVLAKVARDDIMIALAREYPAYGWDRNMGYPTRQHRQAIAAHGATPWHRRSFRLL